MANEKYPFANLFKRNDKEARRVWKKKVGQQRGGKVSLEYIVASVLANRQSEGTALSTLRAYDDEGDTWRSQRSD